MLIQESDKAHTLSMQKYIMMNSKKATNQISVCVTDLPLYVQQKKIQMLFPGELGEDKFVCVLGMLHIKMALQECGGHLMCWSGWETIFSWQKYLPQV